MEKKRKKKIKVAFFSPASYPFFLPSSGAHHGGAEFQMFLLAKNLAKNKLFNICFFVGNYGQKQKSKAHNIQLIRSIKHKQKEFFISKLFKTAKYFFQLIKYRPDLIICTNANAFVGINAFYSKLFKKKFIYRTSHFIDVSKEYINNNGFSGKLYNYGLQNASAVITQNEEHKKLLMQNHGIYATTIRNGIELKDYSYEKKSFILWVGRFQKWKNPYIFLQIAKHFPEKQFIMICPFTESTKNSWNNLNKKAKEVLNLKFIEKVPFYEIQTYFNKAELFINTSDYEGFPNTFLQSALGRTPIVSLSVNPDNFLAKYNCGIFGNSNFDSMLSEIKDLISNKKKQKMYAENLFHYIKENHDVESVGKEFNSVIDKVL